MSETAGAVTSRPRDQGKSNIVIFSRVAKNLIAAERAHEVVPQHVVTGVRGYFERLVIELAGQYGREGDEWFREHYKDFL